MANDDPHNLNRFVAAQDRDDNFTVALSELRSGAKHSHWIWFVFPQYAGLASSGSAGMRSAAAKKPAPIWPIPYSGRV
jgi:uncharacterized protein (DUF1810 family)